MRKVGARLCRHGRYSGVEFAAEFQWKSSTVPVRLLLLSCLAALALAGCGVKGPLEPPKADTTAPAAQSSAAPATAASPSASSPMASAPMTNADAARDAGDQAWGANPVSVGGINPPDMPGNSVSTAAPATSAAKKGFFLDFLL